MYGLHRVIAYGFWGIQGSISAIINKSAVAGWRQLLYPSGDKSGQLNSLINAAPIVLCASGDEEKENRVILGFMYSIKAGYSL